MNVARLFFGVTFWLLLNCAPAVAQTLDDAYGALYEERARDAVEVAERIVEIFPNSSDAWEIRARAYMRRAQEVNIFRKISRLKKALESFERAAELDPTNINVQLALFVTLSVLPESMGGGEENLETQVKTMASAVPGLDELGHALLAEVEERNEDKFQAVDRAIEINPDQPRFRIARLNFYSSAEDWNSAWEELDDARERFPDHLPLMYQEAKLAALSGIRLQKGLACVEALMTRDDLPPRIRREALHLIRGKIHQRQGRLVDARADFEVAEKNAPYLVEEMEMKDDIRALRRN